MRVKLVLPLRSRLGHAFFTGFRRFGGEPLGAMPRRQTDIHFHLLPGVDDGPATIEESVELARAAEEDGTAIIVATPHVRRDHVSDPSDLPERVREMRERLVREGVSIEVRCGGELGHDMVGRLGQRDLDTIAVGPPGASWILLEAPFEGPGEELHLAADELRDRGFGVVLAHPERSVPLMAHNGAGVRRELERGSLLQVNAWSLAGGYGAEEERMAAWLVASRTVSAIASDAHSDWRGPALTVGLEKASWSLTPHRARMLTDSGPRALLERGVPAFAPAA
jgi:protein-tyrosine phosphatase